jgi:hypothetical protein
MCVACAKRAFGSSTLRKSLAMMRLGCGLAVGMSILRDIDSKSFNYLADALNALTPMSDVKGSSNKLLSRVAKNRNGSKIARLPEPSRGLAGCLPLPHQGKNRSGAVSDDVDAARRRGVPA